MSNKNKKTAVIYARSLTNKNGELEYQIRKCKEIALNSGYWVTATFSDVASGMNIHRTGFKKLLEFVNQKKVDVVLTTDALRIARNSKGYELLKSAIQLADKKIQVEHSR